MGHTGKSGYNCRAKGCHDYGNGHHNIRSNFTRRKKVKEGCIKLNKKFNEPALFNLSKGALTGKFYPNNLAVSMIDHYYFNSANYMKQEDIDRLLSAPKYYVEHFKQNGHFIDLSTEFNKTNKHVECYYSSNIEYYASVIDDEVHLFAVAYTNKNGIHSVGITYLPNGQVEKAIFLSRVCYHPTPHYNKMTKTTIEGGIVHIHTASEDYYNFILNNRGDKKPSKIAKDFADPDAVVYEVPEGESSNVKDIAKKLFLLNRHKKIDIYVGKSIISDMKTDINKVMAK